MDIYDVVYNNSDTFQKYEKFVITNYVNEHNCKTVRKLCLILQKQYRFTKKFVSYPTEEKEFLFNFERNRLHVLLDYMKELITIYKALLRAHIGIVPYKLLLDTVWNPVVPIKIEVCKNNQKLMVFCHKCEKDNSFFVRYHKKDVGTCKFCKAEGEGDFPVDTLEIAKNSKGEDTQRQKEVKEKYKKLMIKRKDGTLNMKEYKWMKAALNRCR